MYSNAPLRILLPGSCTSFGRLTSNLDAQRNLDGISRNQKRKQIPYFFEIRPIRFEDAGVLWVLWEISCNFNDS